MTVLGKRLWELYSPGVTLLSEQNPQSQKESARNQFLKHLRTKKIRSLMRKRKKRRRKSPWEPPRDLPLDQRPRGNGNNQEPPEPSAAALSGSSSGCHGTLLKPFPFRVLVSTVSSHGECVFCLSCWEITSKSLPGLRACLMKPVNSLQTFLSICFLRHCVLRTMREPRGPHTAITCADPDELPEFVCSPKVCSLKP